MADVFLDRVARLAGLTVRRLREHQEVLRSLGLTDEAKSLDSLIDQHMLVVFTCSESTSPFGLDTRCGHKRGS